MTDTSSPAKATGHESPPAARKEISWRANFRFAADVIQSLAIPLVTVAATVLGLYATNSLREREIEIAKQNNLQSLRNQREQSETALRSAMFKELVGPLLQTGIDGPSTGPQADLPRAQRLALLAELLTLNFHEHFELGPLLRYVDTLPGQTEDARARLRGTARRVVSRQLAPMLAVVDGPEGTNPGFLEMEGTVQPGANRIEVTVIGTLKNTLGPHHGNPALGTAWPAMFQKAPAAGPPPGKDYSTVGYGLFEPFELHQVRREYK